MDLDDFRSILDTARVDVWAFFDAAIDVASADNADELKRRRDGIVERLYAATATPPRCLNCEANAVEAHNQQNKSSEDEDMDPFGGLFDDEQKKILEIKHQLEDPHQSEDSLAELLQNLADMDITFQALEETDIGRNVNRLRKHSSSEVRRLVKLLVRKWKEIVDEWVKLKAPGEPATASTVIGDDEDSPQQRNQRNGHHQIPGFACSPNSENGNFESSETEPKPKPIPRKEALPKPAQKSPSPLPSVPTPPPPQNRQKESNFDAERLASARKRLQENYKEAANAKKQRTIQVMDLHELPKPKAKNVFFGKNKGGMGSQGRKW
ncbi:hypothetical protein HN51_036976 [Arachis hypogaea]|uniref:TFIIS N-terminal domain-containing protein n=1 Tax=Arachis hypogaea TaxID=3818 RepID=A0A444ZXR3_ARAHY|nr:probable mediator of RNA polymerase II transcription subunit 26c [Arachis ipaensis]XP_025637812.1 probable mediator of RNA polymerase II transcription subunit 26c isoform X1 [Arachis hypogaea]QHO02442.1 putative mediator of RNA polymerase II transcription subunit 26c [Arachis hypogaea]RYR18968.1 hypothetical protein Ahy_B03g063595 [Arachis hypogaea]